MQPQGAYRTGKYRTLRILLWTGNRTLRWLLHRGLAPSAFALLETVGRRQQQRVALREVWLCLENSLSRWESSLGAADECRDSRICRTL